MAFLARTARVGQQPHGIAVDSGRGLAYVANHLGASVSVIHGATGAVVRTLSLGSASGGNGIALDPVSGLLYVANKYTGDVSRVPAEDGAPPLSLPAGLQPDGIAVDPATGIVYVANFGGNTITLFHGATGALLRTAVAGGEPSFIALDPPRSRFYVTHHLAANIGVYALANGDLLRTFPAGAGPYGIAFDSTRDRLYTADRDSRTVTIVDLAAERIVKHMPLLCTPYQVAVNPASGHLFVVCPDDQQLHVFDQDTTLWLGWAPVGRGAEEGIAVDLAAGLVYVANRHDDTVSIIQDSGPRFTPTPPPTRTPAPTPSPTRSPTVTPTPVPTRSPTATPTPSATSTASPTGTAVPSSTSSPTATRTATMSATPAPTATRFLPAKPDRYEPDDTPGQANALTLGDPAQEHTFHQPGDVDWVSFSAIAGGRYLLHAVGAGDTRVTLALYAADGQTLLALSKPGTGPEVLLLWRAPATDGYLLKMSERDGRGGSGVFYVVAAAALSHNDYLPLITTAGADLGRQPFGEGAGAATSPPRAGQREALTAATERASGPSAAVRSLAVDPMSGYLYLAGDDGLVLYDPATGSTLAQAAIGRQPRGIVLDARPPAEEAASRVYVVSGERGAVLALHAATLALLGEATGFVQPGGLALANGRLFVADTAAGSVAILDASDLQELGMIPVGPGPYAVAALPETRRVFVALSGGDGVAVLDADTAALLTTTRLGGLGHPQDLAADRARGWVYVLYPLSPRYRQIAILDGATGDLVRVVPSALDRPLAAAEALALDPRSGRLWVSAAEGMYAFDPAGGAWTRLPGDSGRGPAPVFGLALDANRGSLFAIQPRPAAIRLFEAVLTARQRSCIIPADRIPYKTQIVLPECP